MNEEDIKLSDDFIDSLKSLGQVFVANQDSAAAMLYRLMFRHERNISVLDKYSDQLLDGLLGMGGEFVEEDYKNFLQYLKIVVPSEYEAHKKMFDEFTAEEEDIFDEEENA